MFDIDIEFEDIETIKDIDAKKIAHQLRINGIASTQNKNISRMISKRMPLFRDENNPKILIAPDRHMKRKIISINPELINPDKELERFLKQMIKMF